MTDHLTHPIPHLSWATPTTPGRGPIPLVGADIWQAVMTEADYRCRCDGRCGLRHRTSAMWCGVHHETWTSRRRPEPDHDRLIAAPADAGLSPAEAASLPGAELQPWCTKCHRAAVRRARADQQPTGVATLF